MRLLKAILMCAFLLVLVGCKAGQKTGTRDAMPPEISAGSPSGRIATDTPVISVRTDKPAECKASLKPGEKYEVMPYAFEKTGGKEHSTKSPIILKDGTYTVYVRCKSGIPNQADYKIAFTVQKTTPENITNIPKNVSNPPKNVTHENASNQSPKNPPNDFPRNDKLGINTGVGTNHPLTQAALRQSADAGFAWIRLLCDWRAAERTDNSWDFSSCDEPIEEATKMGLRPIVQLWTDSPWCHESPGTDPKSLKTKPRKCTDDEFRDYVFHVVSRYGPYANGLGSGYGKNLVTYFEMGNEPDLDAMWNQNPKEYAAMMHLAFTYAHEANPNARISNGGFAAGGGQSYNANFIIDVFADTNYPLADNMDFLNYHTYGLKKDMASKLQNAQNLAKGKPIWITEVGYPSSEEYQKAYRSIYPYPSGEEGQVGYMNDVVPYLIQLGAEKVFWYTLVDIPSDKTEFCTYGLFYIYGKQCLGSVASGNLTKKKSYNAYKQLADSIK